MSTIENYIKNARDVDDGIREWALSFDVNILRSASLYFETQFHKDAEAVSYNLSSNGWFIWLAEGSLEDSFLRVKSFLGKSQNEQDALAVAYIDSEVKSIESRLLAAYPDRVDIISQVFKAHELGLFGASIPSFFSVAEGICRDLFPGIGLYATVDKQPATNSVLNSVSQLDVFETAILGPLKVKTEVTKTIYQPTQSDHEIFNRHLIIHGNSKGYSSKINSLKAISLVDYVHQSLSHIKQKHTQK